MAKAQIDFDLVGSATDGKSGTTKNGGSFTPNTSTFSTIPIGFTPTSIVFWILHTSNNALVLLYDVVNTKFYRWYDGGAGTDLTNNFKDLIYMDGTDLKYKAAAAGQAVATNYMAIKE